MRQILSIVLSAALCISACKCGQKKNPVQAKPPAPAPAPAPAPTQAPAPKPVVQAPVVNEITEWANKMVLHYPEISWFANAKAPKNLTGQIAEKSYSEQFFGEKFVEFDRTLMSLYCLKWILDGSDQAYQKFTAAQPAAVKLSRESFQALHKEGTGLLNSKNMSPVEMQQALETAIVLGNMGKSEKGKEIFAKFGVNTPDHNEFYGQAMEVLKNSSRLARSFGRLTYPAKLLLIKSANLIHYRHATHLEGGPSLFTKLKQSNILTTDPTAFSFSLLVHICDVAGSMGDVNNSSSIAYTEQTHQAVQAIAKACHVLSDPTKTVTDAFNFYIDTRASWLGLNSSNRDDRVLTQIGAMLRLFTPEEGSGLRNAVLQMSPEDRENIVTQFELLFNDGPLTSDISKILINLSHRGH